ncbi:MAG TPA: hypothetical protein VKB86_13280, partial [Pyrinomonadaceae bacterium]|nr:hypothetical protein [Pyrinomonadaceae bacterium]
MKKRLFLISVATLFVFASAMVGLAQSPNFTASRTFQFDPDNTGGAVAYWKNGIGETDSNCNTKFGLELEKNVPIEANVSAGAVLNGLKGVVVAAGDTLGYDLKKTSPCPAGSPRFNVSWTAPDGSSHHSTVGSFSFVGGCSNDGGGTPSPQDPVNWNRLVFDLQSPAQAFPAIPPGATLQSVVLIVDD